jgi:hypothetical protein
MVIMLVVVCLMSAVGIHAARKAKIAGATHHLIWSFMS